MRRSRRPAAAPDAIVADTNTLVSGFGWGGSPGQVVDTVLSGQVTLVISPALLGELTRVLAYPKLAAVFDDPAVLVAAVAEAADTVDPAEQVTVLADEPDNRVLEAASWGRRPMPGLVTIECICSGIGVDGADPYNFTGLATSESADVGVV